MYNTSFEFKRKIRLYFYVADKHFSLSDFNISRSERVVYPENAYKVSEVPLINSDPELFEIVNDVDCADFIVFPLDLCSLMNRCGIFGDSRSFPDRNDPDGNSRVVSFLRRLPFFDKYEERNLFFSGHDWDGPHGVRCTVISSSVSNLNPNPNKICIPHLMGDLRYPGDMPISYLSNFIGYVSSHRCRIEMMNSLLPYVNNVKPLPVYLKFNEQFHPYRTDASREAARKEFLDVMHQSLTTLCPRGTGFNSVRFFETMCVGRVPILISDNCALPLEHVIDWGSMILRIAESDIVNIGNILESFMSMIDNKRLVKMSLSNRIVWETYLQPSQVRKLYYLSLSKVLSSMQ